MPPKRKALSELSANVPATRLNKRQKKSKPVVPKPVAEISAEANAETHAESQAEVGFKPTFKSQKRTKSRVEANSLPPLPSYEPFRSEFIPHKPKVLLPDGYDRASGPYNLFTLFFTDEVFQELANNTNRYAAIKRAAFEKSNTSGKLQRAWKDCTAGEIKVLFGLWIYMGTMKSQSPSEYWQRESCNININRYWRQERDGTYQRSVRTRYQMQREQRLGGQSRVTNTNQSLRTLATKPIGVVRYEQLKRYFHVSDPTTEPLGSNKEWYKKVEPLSSRLREAYQRFFLPGSKMSIDEMMVKFFGRSKHTIKMKNKPIKQGYKIWALCYQGYTYSFLYYSGVRGIGTAEISQIPGLTPTASAVYHLALTLPSHIYRFDLFMDNLFTNIPLFIELRKIGIGAAGTTRVDAAGFPDCLKIEKDKAKSILQWGHISGAIVEDICCLL